MPRGRSQLAVRRAREGDGDAVAELLYESAVAMYDRFAGGRERALRLLRRAIDSEGTNASREVVWVAELEGRAAGALAAFPVSESPARANAFLRLALRTIRPWRWPPMLWLYWAGARAAPSPPGTSLYVDALATADWARNRGVARALLREAEAEAQHLGLPAVALDTALGNGPARALYASSGFQEMAFRPPSRSLPGFVALVKPLD